MALPIRAEYPNVPFSLHYILQKQYWMYNFKFSLNKYKYERLGAYNYGHVRST